MMTAEGRKSPVHVHVDRETPVHVHLKKKKKGKAGVPTAVEVMKASPCVEPLYGNKINWIVWSVESMGEIFFPKSTWTFAL